MHSGLIYLMIAAYAVLAFYFKLMYRPTLIQRTTAVLLIILTCLAVAWIFGITR